jgi:hypothetical protein
MSTFRFTFFGVRFTPFHRRFTFHEREGNFVSRLFHGRFLPIPFVSRFTPVSTGSLEECLARTRTRASARAREREREDGATGYR